MTEHKYAASLVRGMTYLIHTRSDPSGSSDLNFTKGVEIIIGEDLKEHLEADAVDTVSGEADPDTGERELVYKPKFAFRPYDGDTAVGSILIDTAPVAAPRRRRAA